MNTDLVLKAFAGDRWHTTRELAEQIYYSPRHVRTMLAALVAEGKVERIGRRKCPALYRMAPEVTLRTCRCGHTGPSHTDFYRNYRNGKFYTGCVACRRKRYRDGWTTPIRRKVDA